MQRATWTFWGAALLTALADQLGKLLVWGWSASPRDHAAWTVVPRLLQFKNAEGLNTGVVFGVGEGKNRLWAIIGVLIALFVGWLYYGVARAHARAAAAAALIDAPEGSAAEALRPAESLWGAAVSLSLVLGGAVGNLIDRVAFAGVRDFVEVVPELPILRTHWAAFNLADAAITVGVILYFVFALAAWVRERRLAAAEELTTKTPSHQEENKSNKSGLVPLCLGGESPPPAADVAASAPQEPPT